MNGNVFFISLVIIPFYTGQRALITVWDYWELTISDKISVDKSSKNVTCCRKFCLPKYKKETHEIIFDGKNCLNFELVLNILSAENFVRRIFMMRYFSNVCKYLSPTEPPGVRFPSRHCPHPTVLVHGSREGGPGQTGT